MGVQLEAGGIGVKKKAGRERSNQMEFAYQ